MTTTARQEALRHRPTAASPVPTSLEPQAAVESEIEPDPDSQASAAEPATTEEPPADVTEESGETMNTEADAEEPAALTAELPEPVPFVPARANGAAGPGAATAAMDEPDIIPDGDDRVIALFPTAAARRSRTIVAPADP